MNLVKPGIANFARNRQLWPALYVGKLSLALLFTMPVFVVTDAVLSRSRFAEALLSTWSLDVVMEFAGTHGDLLPVFVAVLLFHAVAAFFLKQFLNGGLYSAFFSQETTNVSLFFGESGRLFRGNIRVSLLMVPVYTVLVIAGVFLAGLVPESVYGLLEGGVMRRMFGNLGIMFLVLIPGFLLSDLLRLHQAGHPSDSLRECFRLVLNFLKSNFVRLIGAYLICFVPYLLIWIIAEYLALILSKHLGFSIGTILELLLFQVCAWLQVGQSLLFTAIAASAYYHENPGRFRKDVQGELTFD